LKQNEGKRGLTVPCRSDDAPSTSASEANRDETTPQATIANLFPNGGENAQTATTIRPNPQPNNPSMETDKQASPPVLPTGNAVDMGFNDQTIRKEGGPLAAREGSCDRRDPPMEVDEELEGRRDGHEDVEMGEEKSSGGDERESANATPFVDGSESTTKSNEVPDKGNSQIGAGGDHMGASTINNLDKISSSLPTHVISTTAASQAGDVSPSHTTTLPPSPTATSPPSLIMTTTTTLASSSTTTSSITTTAGPTLNSDDVASATLNRGAAAAGIINAVVRNVSISDINVLGSADVDVDCPTWLAPTLACLRTTSAHPTWQELVTNLIVFENSGPTTGVGLIFVLILISDFSSLISLA